MKRWIQALIVSVGMAAGLAPALAGNETPAEFTAPVRGARAFSTQFTPTATGLNQKNAYLLMYLCTAIYPEHLAALGPDHSQGFIDRLNKNSKDLFGKESATRLAYLFDSPSFSFISKATAAGYDPEVMVIDSPTAVFVVFRGTDRAAANKVGTFQYQWNEWLKTDFDFAKIDPGETIPGQVHKGFWFSLRLVRDDVLAKIKEYNPKGTKKLWITGHSLGAAYTEVFAAYAESKGVQVQGAYAFAAPHVGDQAFVNYLDSKVPGGRLQRFDFVDDPITVLAPYGLGFARAGVRNYYNDLSSFTYNAAERAITDDIRVFPALAQAGISAVHIDVQSLDSFCFHHPQWYLNAAFNQVARSERKSLPSPQVFGYIAADSEACNELVYARAHSSDPGRIILDTGEQIARGTMKAINAGATEFKAVVEDSTKRAGEAVSDAADTISFNADNLLKNAVGTAVGEGTYYIRCLKGGKYLTVDSSCMGEDGCKLELHSLGNPVNNKFKVVREAPYYRIEIGDKVVDADADTLLDSSTEIQSWTRNMVPGLNQNQKWLFYKVGKSMYLIVSAANMKVLDANDKDVDKNGGRVKLYRGISNDPTQVWILERAK